MRNLVSNSIKVLLLVVLILCCNNVYAESIKVSTPEYFETIANNKVATNYYYWGSYDRASIPSNQTFLDNNNNLNIVYYDDTNV